MCICSIQLLGYGYGHIDGYGFHVIFRFLHTGLHASPEIQEMLRQHFKNKNADAWNEYLRYEKDELERIKNRMDELS